MIKRISILLLVIIFALTSLLACTLPSDEPEDNQGTNEPGDTEGDNEGDNGNEGTPGGDTENGNTDTDGGNTDGGNTNGGNTDGGDTDDGEGNAPDNGADEPEDETEKAPRFSIYSLIVDKKPSDPVRLQTENLKTAIKEHFGFTVSVFNDIGDDTDYEIVIGNIQCSALDAAKEKLTAAVDGEGYIIDISEYKIVIYGTSFLATQRGIKTFINKYVKTTEDGKYLDLSHGTTFTERYNSENIEYFDNGTEVEVIVEATTVFDPSLYNGEFGVEISSKSSHYPSIIVLQHQPNEEDNGKLIGYFCLTDKYVETDACIVQSCDGGNTWSILARPEEQKSPDLVPGQMSHIYELPAQIGEYPAGTLIFSSGSIDYDIRSEIWIWYSLDCGKTWTQTSKVAEGGITRLGVWEPFTFYEDGKLYCFYSDDSDPLHDQKLVFKWSEDGINWSDAIDVCTFKTATDRPGMAVLTKMGNGEYFLVYEYYGPGRNGAVYYKKTADLTDWDPQDPGKQLEVGTYSGKGAPSCLWIPGVTEKGMLIATAKEEFNGNGTHRIFVSFDYGETWTTMENPLPYTAGTDVDPGASTRIGHSPSFVVGPDGCTVYYLNATNSPESGRRRIQFACFKIV